GAPSSYCSAKHERHLKIPVASYFLDSPLKKIHLISCESMTHISDIKLIRTDTTLDLSQKAEKGLYPKGSPSRNSQRPKPNLGLRGGLEIILHLILAKRPRKIPSTKVIRSLALPVSYIINIAWILQQTRHQIVNYCIHN
ncbi:hypothetical protein CR513_22821, partial [Mucuna pruriens]